MFCDWQNTLQLSSGSGPLDPIPTLRLQELERVRRGGISNLDKQPLKINVFPFLFVITVLMFCLIKIIKSVLEVGES